MIFLFIIALVFPAALGYLLLKSLRFSCSAKTALSLSFLLGLGVIALWMLLLLIFHQALTLSGIVIPLVLLFGILYVFLRRNYSPICFFQSPPAFNLSVRQRIFLYGAVFFIAHQLYFVFLAAGLTPIASWDGIYAIAVKSKYLFYGGQLEGLKNFYITSSYPIQMELDVTWLALVLNQWDDQLLKYIFPIFLLAYLPLQYDFVKDFSDRSKALLSVVLVLCSYFLIYHSTIEYRSIFFLVYNLMPVFLIFRAFQRNEPTSLILAGIFAGLSAFIKLEGTGHFLIYVLLILYTTLKSENRSIKAGLLCQVKFLVPALLISVPFWLVKNMYHLGSFEGRLGLQITGFTDRLIPVLSTILQNLFLSGNWSILWFVLLIFVLTAQKASFRSPAIQYIGLTLLLYFALYIGLGLFTTTFSILYYDPYTNLSRTILHFFPLCPILIALLSERNKD